MMTVQLHQSGAEQESAPRTTRVAVRPVDASCSTAAPLCVDLDGTLIQSDLLWELVVRFLLRDPLGVFYMIGWLWRGKAQFKRQISSRVSLDPACLPYTDELLQFLRAERSASRRVILATASDSICAEKIADHLGLFDGVLSSDGVTNLAGKAKQAQLVASFGFKGYAYAGNSSTDLPVWLSSNMAVCVNAPARAIRTLRKNQIEVRTISTKTSFVMALVSALRLHQWAKNLLIFVPIISAHALHGDRLVNGIIAFFSFGFCASATYLFNDLCDLDADRQHPSKHLRSLASGRLSIRAGILLVPALLMCAWFLASCVSSVFVLALLCYFTGTTVYSLFLKRIALLDVLTLAALYVWRLEAGGIAADIELSPWLLTLAIFLFLSLALTKRCAELIARQGDSGLSQNGRAYFSPDLSQLQAFGTTSGYLSVLLLALYVHSPDITALYANPRKLLFICPLLLYWISRVWLLTSRGEMNEDPVLFALKDRISNLVAIAVTIIVLWAI